MQTLTPIISLFNDPDYAWQVLECQIAVQLSQVASGLDVAKLLALYMTGVQKMNSIMDPRQSYFKSKVTGLMSKQNVIKGLNKPMAKKTKYDEVEVSSPERKVSVVPALIQKRKQIQMRLAYGAQQHSPQALKKLLTQQNNKQEKLTKKIEAILSSHDQRLNQRIRKRKLKTTTSRSQVDIQQFQINGKKKMDQNQINQINGNHQNYQKKQQYNRVSKIKKSKSMEINPTIQIIESQIEIKKNRRNTLDLQSLLKDVTFK